MKTSDFYYDLPQELIAQTPIEPRDASRLMVLDKSSGRISHRRFTDIVDLLRPEDCLILNDSRVMPARIYGVKEGTGAHVEFLLLENKGGDTWEALCKPGKRAREGARFDFGEGLMKGEIIGVKEDGNRLVRFQYEGVFFSLLDRIGQMPLPPYIKAKLEDKERYQTIYSRETGSAAAPTAGLHFTPQLLDRLREKGIETGFVTLHVGLGTFRPVSAERIADHKMHAEHYYMPTETAELINRTRARGGRVIAVGTTSCRTIESAPCPGGKFRECAGWTDIFIYPGYTFQGVDGLITNFHLPESTLIMLVSALAGRENVLRAYQEAVKERYRFFSFGDAMFIGDLK
ncbi:tRNA preQ1(34) S-adenosylmethionine ribosyltransferase-isomerase QueA [Acutalibacter sp. 1XD8-33]|uniref:tRNA preQ1(34) S-adenosylmethionine ribosyltransferase-isomerase QueA n=1 Tax=Acutalibacter sp. 1XD8-33 TaxID=2320081 RepID=UPI000EA3869A|nr:tRNA preQ1(34) S-adenosylmethionine ribosyltransferase-isomerase QueA [Acutalibacter sp. 1XD8-33]RKJ40901.1 tRNA preQ1(34) S-adenosylmethionine ribosyltransferase-isomerase QueA [Acutalibacter sp. 1XD8-33]